MNSSLGSITILTPSIPIIPGREKIALDFVYVVIDFSRGILLYELKNQDNVISSSTIYITPAYILTRTVVFFWLTEQVGAMPLIRSVIADSMLTAMWVFSVATLGTLTVISAAALGIQAQSTAGLVLTTAIAFTLMLIFSFLSAVLGGASFNPATTVTFYAAGLRPDSSLLSMAVRFPAQAAAGALGARAISHVMPSSYRHMLRGPSLKVDLHKGAAAEGVLTFAISFLALLIFIKGPRFLVVKIWLLAMVTVGLVIAGSRFTGPSMNPANAFGWAYMNNWHNTWEQFYVYWICPIIGATMAALVFKSLFPIKKPKQKEA